MCKLALARCAKHKPKGRKHKCVVFVEPEGDTEKSALDKVLPFKARKF